MSTATEEKSTTDPWPESPETGEVLARVDALGPVWRERARALDEAVEFPHENFAEAGWMPWARSGGSALAP